MPIFSGRYFPDAKTAAEQYQYSARLRSANARDIKRFGPMRCAEMQHDAAEMYAAARDAMAQDIESHDPELHTA